MAPRPDQVQIGNYVKIAVQTGMTAGDPNATPAVAPEPIFTDLYGERDNSRSDEREGIDASHKGRPHAVTIPGRRSGSISLTLVANRQDVTETEEASQQALIDIYEAGTAVVFQQVKSFPGAADDGSQDQIKQGEGVLLSFSESASDNEVVTYDAELTLNSPLVAVVA